MNIKLRSLRNITGIALVLIAALMLSACASDDAAAAEPTAKPAATAEPPEPTATPEPKIPEVAATTLEVPESGSDEEKIFVVVVQQVRAMNTQDYESFTSTCPPGNWTNDQATWDKLEIWWGQGGEFGRSLTEFTYESFNARDIEFKTFKDGSVQTKFNIYSYDTLLTEGWSWWWEEFDGEWYSTSQTCKGATGRQT